MSVATMFSDFAGRFTAKLPWRGESRAVSRRPLSTAGGVQADTKPARADLRKGLGQAGFQRWFAAAQDHRIEQPTATVEKVQHGLPGYGAAACARLQLRVVAVAAAPWAPLNKNHCAEVARVVVG